MILYNYDCPHCGRSAHGSLDIPSEKLRPKLVWRVLLFLGLVRSAPAIAEIRCRCGRLVQANAKALERRR